MIDEYYGDVNLYVEFIVKVYEEDIVFNIREIKNVSICGMVIYILSVFFGVLVGGVCWVK